MENEEPKPEFHIFNFENVEYKTLYTKKFENRKPYTIPDPKKIYAFIPGTILKIHVKENHKVKKGEPLLILQAMKMNNILLSPLNGVVKKVYVKVGEMVPKSQMLVELK
jgi:biotin carboxyl carrier protein